MTVKRKVGDTEIEVSSGYLDTLSKEFTCRVKFTISESGMEHSASWHEKNVLNLVSDPLARSKGVPIDWPHVDEM